jgi:hypothetical protein
MFSSISSPQFVGLGQPGAQVRITDPFSSLITSVSLKPSPEVSTSSNSRRPVPAVTGMIQKQSSSIRRSRTNVSSRRLVPYLMSSFAGLVLQPGDRAGWVGPEQGGSPCRLGQRPGGDVLGHGVDAVDVRFAGGRAPVRGQLLVGHTTGPSPGTSP